LNDGHIRVLLLKETSVLYNEVQMILFDGKRVLPKIGGAACDTLDNAAPSRVAAINDNLFSEPMRRPVSGRDPICQVEPRPAVDTWRVSSIVS
jgi:hypothetical protein